MKLKEKFQRFWTLSKSREGFTLVELIVVIAILAILAGVAIPAYSGYINKANEVADLAKLDAVATAVQAANATAGKVTKIEIDSTGTKITITAEGDLATGFKADFATYYGAGDLTSNVYTLNTAINLSGSSYAGGATWTPATGWSK